MNSFSRFKKIKMALVGVVCHNHGLSESPVDIGVLSKKLVQFEKTFNHRSVDKGTALNFAAQLSSLSDRIRNSYPQEQPVENFIDLTETLGLQDPVETDGNYHGFIACGVSKEPQVQSPRCSRRPPSASSNRVTNGSRAKGIDISEISALGYECAMEKQQKLQSEANEILSKVKKSPSTFQCGMGYTGTPEEKRFSDNVKDIVHENLPELKIKKNIFHYMAFVTLDRFYCKCCLKCPNKPEMLYKWVEGRSTRSPGSHSRLLSPRPMVCVLIEVSLIQCTELPQLGQKQVAILERCPQ